MRSLLMFALVAVCATLFAGEASAQTRYTLHCRTGGDMNLNVAGTETGGSTEIIVGFARSTATRGLAPGQCTWLDRVVNSREPRAFKIVFRARSSVDFRPRAGDHGGDRADAFVSVGPDTEAARAFFRAMEAGGSFEVQAWNPGRGFMDAINFREVPAR